MPRGGRRHPRGSTPKRAPRPRPKSAKKAPAPRPARRSLTPCQASRLLLAQNPFRLAIARAAHEAARFLRTTSCGVRYKEKERPPKTERFPFGCVGRGYAYYDSIPCRFWRPGLSTREWEEGAVVAVRHRQRFRHLLAFIRVKRSSKIVAVCEEDVYRR